MAHYLITVQILNKTIKGIRQHDNVDLELMFRKYRLEAQKDYHSILDFDVVMLSKQSQVYKDYMRKKSPEKKVDLYRPPMFGS